MSHPWWSLDDLTCLNCQERMVPVLARSDGQAVAWCRLCGAICTPNFNEPTETDNWCVPADTRLRDLPFAQCPVFYDARKPPLTTRALIDVCGFTGHTISREIKLLAVVAVRYDRQTAGSLDAGSPVHLTAADGQVVQVEGTFGDWLCRVGEAYRYAERTEKVKA